MLTAILGIFAAASYTLKGYFNRFAKMFRKDRPDIDSKPGQD